MDSTNYSLPISTKEPLLQEQTPAAPSSKKPRFEKLKPLFFSLLILVIVIACSMILSSIYKKIAKPNAYLSGSSKYFCHLTRYPDICFTSMSSIISTTALKSGPGPIFSASLLVAIIELNNTATSITKALPPSNPVLLSTCLKQVHDSLSRLNESLVTLGDDSDIESLSYAEMDDFVARGNSARRNTRDCFLALEEINDDKLGVGEVKLGVERAMKHIIISMSLFRMRESILFYFYNPYYNHNDYNYYYSYHPFEFRVLIYLYPAMYLFLALLYFMFWRGH